MTSLPPRSTYGADQAMVLEQQSPEGAGRVEQGRQEINQLRCGRSSLDLGRFSPTRHVVRFPPGFRQMFAKEMSDLER